MNDLVEYEILKIDVTSIKFKIDNKVNSRTFTNVKNLNAFILGLETGDGYNSPLILCESDWDFEKLKNAISKSKNSTVNF